MLTVVVYSFILLNLHSLINYFINTCRRSFTPFFQSVYFKYSIPCRSTKTVENPPFHDMIYFEMNVYYQHHQSARYTNN